MAGINTEKFNKEFETLKGTVNNLKSKIEAAPNSDPQIKRYAEDTVRQVETLGHTVREGGMG